MDTPVSVEVGKGGSKRSRNGRFRIEVLPKSDVRTLFKVVVVWGKRTGSGEDRAWTINSAKGKQSARTGVRRLGAIQRGWRKFFGQVIENDLIQMLHGPKAEVPEMRPHPLP